MKLLPVIRLLFGLGLLVGLMTEKVWAQEVGLNLEHEIGILAPGSNSKYEIGAQEVDPNPEYEIRAQEVVLGLTQSNGLKGWFFNLPQHWPVSQLPRRLAGVSWDLSQSPARLQSLVLTGLGLQQEANLSNLPFLRRLEVGDNDLRSVKLSGNPALEVVMVTGNILTSLSIPDSPGLRHLGAGSNNLRTLDLYFYPKLQELFISGNRLMEIHLDTVTALENLQISNNRLLYLNTLSNSKLQRLLASFNSLESLDVSANPFLIELKARKNQLTRVSVSANPDLIELDLGQNKLREMDLTRNSRLIHLALDQNLLNTLDLSAQTQLKTLKAGDNPISSITLGDNRLSELEVLNLQRCRLPLSRLAPLVSVATGRTRLEHQGPVFFETLQVVPGQGLDFSGEALIGESPTKFTVITEKGRRAARDSWSLEQGIITFYKPGSYRIQMTNPVVVSTEKKDLTRLERTFKVKVETGIIEVKI